MQDAVIRVDHVSKVYHLYKSPKDRLKEIWSLTHRSFHDDHYALRDISFEVYRGECVGIIGTNGSGKSTLLKIITGVLEPTGGTVQKEGKISALLELGTGFNMEYTGRKNIYLNGLMMGYTHQEMDGKVQQIIDFAEIGDYIDQPVKTYSSGMFARLAFAVAINVEPDILIVDEALSVGDIFFQAKCYKKFNEFQEQGKTILFVSHDLGSVLKYCDRCLLINKGDQIEFGNTAEVVNRYRKLLVENAHEQDKQVDEDVRRMNEHNAHQKGISAEKEVSGKMKDQMVLNPNVSNYGNGKAEIIDFAIVDETGMVSNSVSKNAFFKVVMKVVFLEELRDPIFAYTVKDLKGQDITGTNTYLEGLDTGLVHKGEVREVIFRQNMLLQGGQYMLSLGCTGYEGETFVVHHRLYDVCNLHVLSERNTIGVVDLNAKVSIKQEG